MNYAQQEFETIRRRIDTYRIKEINHDYFIVNEIHFRLQSHVAKILNEQDSSFLYSCYSRSRTEGKEEGVSYYVYGEKENVVFEIALHIRIGKENVYRFRQVGEAAIPPELFYACANTIEEIVISLPEHRLLFTTGICKAYLGRMDEENE